MRFTVVWLVYVTGYQNRLIINIISMIKALIVVLLCTTALGFSTYSYTFSAQATSKEVQPSYSLGSLTLSNILAVTIQIPYPNTMSLSNFVVTVMNGTNQLAITTLTFTGYSQTVSWVVTASGYYYLRVTTGSADITNWNMYYLSATVNGAVVLRLTDVLRNKVFKYFYLSPTDSTSVIVTAPTSVSSINIIKMSSSNQFAGVSTLLSSPTTVSGYNTFQVTALTSGYYGLVFATDVVFGVTVTYQGSSYPCPYSSLFADYYGVFTGCSSSSTAKYNGLPCTAYDTVTLDCTACLSGYSLNNGYCTSSIACGSREYIHFGSCYSVNSDCDLFNLYTGACTTCKVSTSIVVNGLCVPNNVVICANGTHLYGTQCIPDICSAVSTNGSCTACASNAYYVQNGTCKPIDCGVGRYFSTYLNNCTVLPSSCLNFSVLAQNCQDCSSGYFKNPLTNYTCEKPYYSANCQSWDFTNNKCSMCNTGYTWNINLCILTVANNCQPGQVIIQNQCVNLPDRCLSINSYRICTQCESGYSMTAGYCQKCTGPNIYFPCVTCPINQYIDATGSCRSTSPYCSTINQSTGLCNSCASGAAPVSGICCPTGQSVTNGVCQRGGSSTDVPVVPKSDFALYYKFCLYYNSQSSSCTQCLNGHVTDYADHCA